MNELNLRTPLIYRSVVALTLLASSLAIITPDWLNNYGIGFVVLLIILIGVPHGVADCLIFKYSGKSGCVKQKVKFYLNYILLIFVATLCLYVVPNIAMSAFIAISAYHLGQAHLSYLSLPNSKLIRVGIYSAWGAFVIFVPILLNPQEVTEICSQFFRSTWIIDLLNQKYLSGIIVIINLLILSFLKHQCYLSKQTYLKEILNLLILTSLFFTAPLIISFGIYFTLWHSLGSTLDQIQWVRYSYSSFGFKTFYLQVIPLTFLLVSLFGMTEFFLSESNFYHFNMQLLTSLFFGSLAAITLPHALLRDRLYQN